jgi:hemerythrin HHE cation binding domain-containing protein
MDCPDVTMMFVVHNAFRRDLNRMQAAAAQADDPAARTALRAGWATFSRYLTVRHTAEDEMLWPPMRTKLLDRTDETDLLVKMADEHSRLDPVLREIDDNLARGATSRLVALFDELAAVLTGHLDHEEAAALPLVQQTLTSREWKAFGDDQRRRIGMNGAGWFFPWLLDDTSRATRNTVLDIVPPPLRLVYRLIWEPPYRRQSPWRREPSARR